MDTAEVIGSVVKGTLDDAITVQVGQQLEKGLAPALVPLHIIYFLMICEHAIACNEGYAYRLRSRAPQILKKTQNLKGMRQPVNLTYLKIPPNGSTKMISRGAKVSGSPRPHCGG